MPPREATKIIFQRLAPLAVSPDYQRQGIGSLLMRESLKECVRSGFGAVVVLGHPAL